MGVLEGSERPHGRNHPCLVGFSDRSRTKMLKKGARGDGLCTPSGQQLPAHFRWTMCDLEPIFAKNAPPTRCPPSLRLGYKACKTLFASSLDSFHSPAFCCCPQGFFRSCPRSSVAGSVRRVPLSFSKSRNGTDLLTCRFLAQALVAHEVSATQPVLLAKNSAAPACVYQL